MTNQPSAMMIQRTGRHGRSEYRVFYPSPNGQRETCRLVDERTFYAIKECAGEPVYQDGAYWAFAPQSQPAPRPISPRPATVEAAVAEMVALGVESNPRLEGRLKSAEELVLDGCVKLAGDTAKLGPYTITAEACSCADFQHRGGWCKHRLAVRMARHLAANDFELPRPTPAETTPQISPKNLALIASGRVVDEEQRRRQAYYGSHHAAHTAALRRLGNGAKSLPADLARRAGITNNREANDGR